MSGLPADFTPPPRSIVHIEAVPYEDGGGFLIGCDCATTTHLVFEEDADRITEAHELAFTCDGCHSVHWFTIGPLGTEPAP